MLAQILERKFRAVAHFLVDVARDVNPPRLREPLQTRGNVDPVAMDIIAVDHHVAQVNAEAELHAFFVRQAGVVLGKRALDFGGGTNGIHNARELRQQAVAHGFEDATVVLGERRVDEIGAQALEGRQRAFLVRANQARVTDQIGGQNGGETALHGIPP